MSDIQSECPSCLVGQASEVLISVVALHGRCGTSAGQCQENVKDQFYSSYKTYVKVLHPPMSLWTGEAGLGYLTTNGKYKSC